MKIYQVRLNMDDYSYFDTNGKIISIKNNFNGSAYQNWETLKVTLKGNKLKEPDMKSIFSTVFGVNENTKIKLKKFCGESVEFLPLKYKKPHWLTNTLTVVDAIDYENSKSVRTPSGILTHFEQYSFQLDKIKNLTLFKIPVFLTTRLYATELFKEFVKQEGLTGADFIEIWDSEK